MKEYVCTVCGYVHKGELTADFVCPVCGAGADAFKEVTPSVHSMPTETSAAKGGRHEVGDMTMLSALELSAICSNLARGCEKQYLAEQSEKFARLAEFFRSRQGKPESADVSQLLAKVQSDLSEGYPAAQAVARKAGDRGAMRALVWGEKVTAMLKSLLARYEREGEAMLKNTGVFVCTVCGFIYIGDKPPEICSVCKVPAWKFEKVQGGAK